MIKTKSLKGTIPPVINGVKFKKSELDTTYIEINEMIPSQNYITPLEHKFTREILSSIGIDCETRHRIEITTDIEEMARLVLYISRSKPNIL